MNKQNCLEIFVDLVGANEFFLTIHFLNMISCYKQDYTRINFHFKLHGESWCQAGMGHSNCQTTA